MGNYNSNMYNDNNIVSYIEKRTKISIDEALCYNGNVEWNGNKVYAIEEIPVYNGKKGGKFYYNKSGNKIYI